MRTTALSADVHEYLRKYSKTLKKCFLLTTPTKYATVFFNIYKTRFFDIYIERYLFCAIS